MNNTTDNKETSNTTLPEGAEPVDPEARSIVDIGKGKYAEGFVVGDHIINHIRDWEGYLFAVESFRIKDVVRWMYVATFNQLIIYLPEPAGETSEVEVEIHNPQGQSTGGKKKIYQTLISARSLIIAGTKVITDFLTKYYGCMDYDLPAIFPGFTERQETLDMLTRKQEEEKKADDERRANTKEGSGKILDIKGNKMPK